MVKKIIKSEYEAPQAEVIEARVERGFLPSSRIKFSASPSAEGIGSGSNYGENSFSDGDAESSGSSYDGSMFSF